MPKRADLKDILIIGSGPIVIGQACEFDYAGAQACKALREEGCRVILVNSNPATIMTDPEFSDATYIEPLSLACIEKVIELEKPQALLPTLGGQTALNLALELEARGILERHNIELIGANTASIERGESREHFRKLMLSIGVDLPQSHTACSFKEARKLIASMHYPLIIRPSFTLGGSGGGVAYNQEEFKRIVTQGLQASPQHQVLIEEYLDGWKEYEMEVMRDSKDQCVLICAIENIDPMGIHTGDSITVAPAMTLTDNEYQAMRDEAFAVIRAVGVATGGSNIQFALDPSSGRRVVIEMNPRVSRSSALASKATGYPIAKIAAKLAIGYNLEELANDITASTPASFEPSIDYVVTKIPRFTFEKFPGTNPTLSSCMKSVGEAMGIGSNFQESFQKALHSLETGLDGFGTQAYRKMSDESLRTALTSAGPDRIVQLYEALRRGWKLEELHGLTRIDPWFLDQFQQITQQEKALSGSKLETIEPEALQAAKQNGFSDAQLARILQTTPEAIQQYREHHGIQSVYHLVDTCAAEFQARTPYYYSSHTGQNESIEPPAPKPSSAAEANSKPAETIHGKSESQPSARASQPSNHARPSEKILIIGGGPNRIGQGIEFDYCCVHASYALREEGYLSVMVNSNPETVSTDYDTSDKLYFEPLSLEHVLGVYRQENCQGAIVQLGGQTPLNLAAKLKANGVRIIGTPPEKIEAAENRESFKRALNTLGLKQPKNASANTIEAAYELAEQIGFPILLRPSFVLGGRGMFIVEDSQYLRQVAKEAFRVAPGQPVLLDKFLENATEIDVDAISDGRDTFIGGILEHIEFAGVHSGDATMVLPAHTLSKELKRKVQQATAALAREFQVVGLMNVQYAIKDKELYVLELNPRASRTVPFISKATGMPLAKLATGVMLGKALQELNIEDKAEPPYWAVKASVFPFARFPGSTISLSPEMRSTGEVMGLDADLGLAIAKAQMGAQPELPTEGNAFFSVCDADKPKAPELAAKLIKLGFKIFSTEGTLKVLQDANLEAQLLPKLSEARRPNVIDMLKDKNIQLIINTPSGQIPRQDENLMRAEAVRHQVPMASTIGFARSIFEGIAALRQKPLKVRSLQAYHKPSQSRDPDHQLNPVPNAMRKPLRSKSSSPK